MISLITGSLLLSVLHALIPNHWLPILAIGRQEQWSIARVTQVTLISGLAHVTSTVSIGLLLALLGSRLAGAVEGFARYAAPAMLISLGVFYIYQHARHHHFHLHGHPEKATHEKIVLSLAGAMFLSPCFEIEPYFLLAGAESFFFAVIIGVLYSAVSITGMILWVRLTYISLLKLNWHAIEHNAGIITGFILIATGVASYFIR